MAESADVKDEVIALAALYPRKAELDAALLRLNEQKVDIESKLAEVEQAIADSVAKIRGKVSK